MAFKPNLNLVKKPIEVKKSTEDSDLKNQIYKILKVSFEQEDREKLIKTTENIYELLKRNYA